MESNPGRNLGRIICTTVPLYHTIYAVIYSTSSVSLFHRLTDHLVDWVEQYGLYCIAGKTGGCLVIAVSALAPLSHVLYSKDVSHSKSRLLYIFSRCCFVSMCYGTTIVVCCTSLNIKYKIKKASDLFVPPVKLTSLLHLEQTPLKSSCIAHFCMTLRCHLCGSVAGLLDLSTLCCIPLVCARVAPPVLDGTTNGRNLFSTSSQSR